MNRHTVTLKLDPFIRCIALKVGLFESEIIDERNFGLADEDAILTFEEKYCYRDDCIVVKVEM